MHSAIGHYDLQFAVFPPLIIDAACGWRIGRVSAVRGGLWLGLLVTAQLFITEEILLGTAIAAVVLLIVLAASRPRAVRGQAQDAGRRPGRRRLRAAWSPDTRCGCSSSARCSQHGSPFTPDFFKNDLSTFVVPSSFMLFHTAGSAAEALRYQGHLPEYLGYLGWPLLMVLVGARWPSLAAAAGRGRPR